MKSTYIVLATVILCSAFLFSPAQSVAQTPCGNISAPEDWTDPNSAIVTTAIENCGDPFFVTTEALSPYTLTMNGKTVAPSGTIAVDHGGTQEYEVEGVPLYGMAQHFLFLHDGTDYRFIDTTPLPPQEADYRARASEFFSAGTDIEPYIAAIMDGSYYIADDIMRARLNSFLNYFNQEFIPRRPLLRAGTYTLVSKDFAIVLMYESFFDTLREFFIPTANAWLPNPYNGYTFTLTFTITEKPSTPKGASSVLFLPGIEASRLYKKGLFGTVDRLWEPNWNQDLLQLSMSDTGVSDNTVYTREIMDKIFGFSSVYSSFIEFMDKLVTDKVINEWAPFAYDWRYSVIDVANNGTHYENEIRDAVAEIERLAGNSLSGRVTLIGHSNGGLLAKAIMLRLERERKSNLVDRVIFLASPQLGTPEAIASILHGYGQKALGGLVIDDSIARDVIHNFTGAYGLVPGQKYFDINQGLVTFFDTSSSTQNFRHVYGNAINNESELVSFMTGAGDGRAPAQTVSEAGLAHSTMLEGALTQHRDQLDGWVAPTGVQVFEVVGEGLDTVSGLEYDEFTERICSDYDLFGNRTCDEKQIYQPVPLISQYADQTVIAASAEGYRGTKETYYVDLDASDASGGVFAVEHGTFTENPSVQNLIQDILVGSSTNNIQFITQSRPTYNNNRILFGAHSPVTMEVVDKNDNKVGREYVGPDRIPQAKEEILGSSYIEMGGGTYIVLPANSTYYDIVLHGTGDGGLTFTLDSLNGETKVPQVSVRVATITASTTIKLSYATGTLSNLQIDTNSDGKTDIELTPKGEVVLRPVTYVMLRTAIAEFHLSNARKAPLMALVNVAETLSKISIKKKANSPLVKLTLVQLKQALERYVQKEWLVQKQIDPITQMISSLNKI